MGNGASIMGPRNAKPPIQTSPNPQTLYPDTAQTFKIGYQNLWKNLWKTIKKNQKVFLYIGK